MRVKVPLTRGCFVVPEAEAQAVTQLKRRFEKQVIWVVLFTMVSGGVWIFLWGISKWEANSLIVMMGVVVLKLVLNLREALLERIGRCPRQPMDFEQIVQWGAGILIFAVLLFSQDRTEKSLVRSLASVQQKCSNSHLDGKPLEICKKYGFR